MVWDVLFGRCCPGCGAPVGLCEDCAAALRGPQTPHTLDLWADLPPESLLPGGRVWAGVEYPGPVAGLIGHYKDHGRVELGQVLGVRLAQVLSVALESVLASAAPGQRVCLVPMPSRAAARRERGRDPVADLVRTAAGELRRQGAGSIRCVRALKVGRVADQAGLSAVQRQRNLTGRVQVHPAALPLLEGAVIVLADDVVTTGASLRAACAALHAVGLGAGGGACLAWTPRRSAGTK